MPFSLHGIPVSRGVAIGRAYLIVSATVNVSHYLVHPDHLDAEITRFSTAQAQVQTELERLTQDLPADAPAEMAAFLHVHTLILRDPLLMEATIALIQTRRYNAEWALTEQLARLAKHFDGVEDTYLRERKADIAHVVERILQALSGSSATMAGAIARNSARRQSDAKTMIIVAQDIAPIDMLHFKSEDFSGFITELGAHTSHTAIMARSLNIPAAVGVPQASQLICEGDLIIIDGDHGIVIVDPCAATINEYTQRQNAQALAQSTLKHIQFAPTQTICGTAIHLYANIELPDDATAALNAGAVGIGLFRTEFLFMNRRGNLPDEDEQFAAYQQALTGMQGHPVTIRTIDVGADKALDTPTTAHFQPAPNPALGLRAIRWSLADPPVFLTQCRAILRASSLGPVKILIPMLAHAREIDQALELINFAKSQLDERGLAYDPQIPIGAMIEIPAAVMALPLFLKRLNFLSIGTNDLIQYTLAIDRANSAVAHLYDPLHPAILYLIHTTLQAALQANIPVAVCGEMAGDPRFTRLLLGMGLTEFSLHPSQLLLVKQEILRAHLKHLEKPIMEILTAYEPEAVQAALHRLAQA